MRSIQAFMMGLLLVVLFITGCRSNSGDNVQAADTEAGKSSADKSNRVTIPAGTVIQIRLTDTLGSERSRSGEKFAATLDQPIVVNGSVAIPRGADVEGRVIDARPSGHLKTPAALSLTLTSVRVGGQTYEIQTSHFGRAGQSHKKRDAEWIGGSAAGGALIGALVGKGKGAAIGAAAGAGGGTAAAYATGKKDILLPSETQLRFVLKQPVSIVKG